LVFLDFHFLVLFLFDGIKLPISDSVPSIEKLIIPKKCCGAWLSNGHMAGPVFGVRTLKKE